MIQNMKPITAVERADLAEDIIDSLAMIESAVEGMSARADLAHAATGVVLELQQLQDAVRALVAEDEPEPERPVAAHD